MLLDSLASSASNAVRCKLCSDAVLELGACVALPSCVVPTTKRGDTEALRTILLYPAMAEVGPAVSYPELHVDTGNCISVCIAWP